jgi:hypothetical protein
MSKLFVIEPNSRVKATGGGYYYIAITDEDGKPDTKHGMKLKDRNKRYLYEHVAKMELHLGRYLKKNEQVDHRDGNKANNDFSNLKLSILGDHQRDHSNNRGNHFWETSPMNKPKRKKKAAPISREAAQRVVLLYLS